MFSENLFTFTMCPRLILSLLCLAVFMAATPRGFSENPDGGSLNNPGEGQTGIQVLSALLEALAQRDEEQPEIKCLATDLHDKFEKLEDPPLAMGHTGDRVRELQATLNKELSGKVLALRHPVLVGQAKGPRPAARDKQRLAYSHHRQRAFQIRGDWEPAEDAAGNPLVYDPDEDHREVSFLKLPPDPLKVDGIFGQHTKAAVALFQHEQNLPVSGEVDAVTLDKLEPLVPTNPLLAVIMSRVENVFRDNDNFAHIVKTVTSLLATVLILLAATVVYQITRSLTKSTHFLSRWLFTPESSPWFTAFMESKVFRSAAQFGPALFIYVAAQVVFPNPDIDNDVFPYLHTFQDWNILVSRFGLAYTSLVLMLVGFGIANAVDSVANPDQETDNPIGSIIRASKRIIGFLGTLLIVASLAGKSPFLIVGGLGAFMAIFMVVFRDSLLGLVASVQIIGNKVVQIGDWISMPGYHADGEVQKISLTLIKVQNADKTISTIPTGAILTESFQNWTGVERSGGRRIKRSILIDMRRIKVCTPDMIERFEKIELIENYLERKKIELEDYNLKHAVEASAVNSRRLTNIGTFRAYLDEYLNQHPGLSSDMTILVRHLQPTSSGLPIEIYAFCNTTEWAKYEAVQADIFDHVLAILPEFELRAFQELTESDAGASPADPRLPATQAGLAEIESLVEAKNRELEDNPRTRPSSRVQSVKKRIAELDLSNHYSAKAKGRQIVLEHLREC